jgi:hypothetical protein
MIPLKTIAAIIALGCLSALPGCQDAGTEVRYLTRPVIGDHSNIPDPHERWLAYHLTSYVLEQQVSCFCPHGADVCEVYVRNNQIIDVVRKSDGSSIFAQAGYQYKTAEELFALASSINPDSVASLVIQYDERFGFPKYIAIDFEVYLADEEVAYSTRNVVRLMN